MRKKQGLVRVSFVVPLYRCVAAIKELHERIAAVCGRLGMRYQIVFVDDASPDADWQVVLAQAKKDANILGIRFSRNFGQHTAITAGIDQADGDWVVVMDGDLQDRPEDLVQLWEKACEGYDIVQVRRIDRRDGFFKRLASWAFGKCFSVISGKKVDSRIGNYSIISAQVAARFREMRELGRSYPLFVEWLGFRSTAVDVVHAARPHGKSAYSLKRMLRFALTSIMAFSARPLYFSIYVGFCFAALAFSYGVFAVFKYLYSDVAVLGWTSLISAVFFVGGLILVNLGVVGLYLGKVFDEVRHRPLYVIAESTKESGVS